LQKKGKKKVALKRCDVQEGPQANPDPGENFPNNFEKQYEDPGLQEKC